MSKIKAWWKSFMTKHIVAEDPNPGYSNLDRLDGLGHQSERSRRVGWRHLTHDDPAAA